MITLDADTRRRKYALKRQIAEIEAAEKAERPPREKLERKVIEHEPGEQTPRKAIPDAWKPAILARQDLRCAVCHEVLGSQGIEYDHVLPIALKGAHAIENVQALCPRPCHLEKTKADVKRIAKAKRQAKMMQPRETSKRRKWPRRGFA